MYLSAREFEARMPDATHLYSDEPEMESSWHYLQLMLLVASLQWHWRERQDFFIGANLTVYFSRQQLRSRDFRGPDFFLVRDTTPQPRASWVVWEENGRYPDLIVELLSDSTAGVDRTVKKKLYQDQFRTPEYFWFSPDTLEFAGFRLAGKRYQPLVPTAEGWYWSEVLELFLGVVGGRLRYLSATGVLIPTLEEAAQQGIQQAVAAMNLATIERQRANTEQQRADAEQQRADTEQQRADAAQQQAEAEKQRADQLAQRLRQLGIDPDRSESTP